MRNTLLRSFMFPAMGLVALRFFGAKNAADIVKIEHRHYVSYFSRSELIPVILTYDLTSDMLSCQDKIPRKGIRFVTDPDHKDISTLAKDYKGSGFDKGHNMSAADNSCELEGMKECFYFSNMTPQPHSFNAGRWKDLETLERKEALEYGKLVITVGSLGVSERIGEDKVAVPKEMWKVIYIPSTNQYQCYLFPNTDDVKEPLESYVVDQQELEDDADVEFNKGKVSIPEE